jgi:hypothetical protein
VASAAMVLASALDLLARSNTDAAGPAETAETRALTFRAERNLWLSVFALTLFAVLVHLSQVAKMNEGLAGDAGRAQSLHAELKELQGVARKAIEERDAARDALEAAAAVVAATGGGGAGGSGGGATGLRRRRGATGEPSGADVGWKLEGDTAPDDAPPVGEAGAVALPPKRAASPALAAMGGAQG